MKNYWILTRLLLKNMAGAMNPFTGIYEDGKKKQRAIMRLVGIALLAVFGIGSVIFLEVKLFDLAGQMGDAVNDGFRAAGMPATIDSPMKLIPALAILAASLLTLILGLFQGLSDLYQGKDAPFLAVLPLSSRQVYAARLTALYMSEQLVNLLLMGPAFVLYAVKTGSALPVILTGIPVFLLTPVIPLALVALLSALLMRISAFARHRESITMGLSMAFAIAYSVAVTRFNSSSMDNNEAAVMSLLQENGMVSRMVSIFPPARWAVLGLYGEVSSLLLLAGVSAAAVAAIILVIGPGYLEQALSSTERTVVTRRNVGEARMERHSVLRTLHALEWKQLLRTPSWVYNGLAGVIMFPLMMGIGFVTGVSSAPDGLPGLVELLKQVNPAYIIVFGAAIMCFGSMVNPVVSTAVSREGGSWPFALALPVHQKDRLAAKLLAGMEINLLCSVLIGIVCAVITRVPVTAVLGAIALSAAIDWAVAAFSLWYDARHPRFKWTNEMEAIKKNFNQFIGMLLWLACVALCTIVGIFSWKLGPMGFCFAVTGMALFEAVTATLLLFSIADKSAVLAE